MVKIVDMLISDLSEPIELWMSIPKLRYSPAFDAEKRLTKFLNKNAGFSTVAKLDSKIVGALLC